MKIRYSVNGRVRECSTSNDDLLIETNIKDNRLVCVVKALKELSLVSAIDTYNYDIDPNDSFFINGYQSWTSTKEVPITHKEKNAHKFRLLKFLVIRPYGDYDFYKSRSDRLHSYDIFYVKGNNEIFYLNNNYKNAYLIIELMKKKNLINLISDVEGKKLKKDEKFTIYDYEKYQICEEGFKVFNEKYPKKNLHKIFGYTSWYNYYQKINESIMYRDLKGLDSRFDLFQIDDGYETYVGDWKDVDPVKFPNGLKPIVERIHEKGLKAGLWLAPFVAEKNSKLFKEHPEYFKLDKHGKPIQVGVNWSGQFALDLDKPEVRKYIKGCLKHYSDMGFDFFKLDFIYSFAYVHDGITHAEASQKSYEFLKESLKGKIILGCGATLPNVYNNFDYVRVGPDASLSFDDHIYMRVLHRERPSTKATIQNTIYRSFMNDRWFGNDPDVFLLRDNHIQLSKEQRRALVTINALFGSVLMTSDDVGQYDESKKKLLDRALELYKNATDVQFETNKDVIHISYKLGEKTHEFDYLVKKGVMKNER